MPLKKCALLRVEQKRARDFFKMAVLDEAGGGAVAEEIIDRGRHFERALVAVAAHGFEPARIEHAAANHAHELFAERAHLGLIGPAGVAVIGRRRAAPERFDRGAQAALELEVIV